MKGKERKAAKEDLDKKVAMKTARRQREERECFSILYSLRSSSHACLSYTTQIADLRGQQDDMMKKEVSGLEVMIMGNACNQKKDVLTPSPLNPTLACRTMMLRRPLMCNLALTLLPLPSYPRPLTLIKPLYVYVASTVPTFPPPSCSLS